MEIADHVCQGEYQSKPPLRRGQSRVSSSVPEIPAMSLDPGALMSMFADEGGEDDWTLFPSGPVPAVLPSAAHALVDQAKRLSLGSETDRQLAVIFAQSACEMLTEQTLATLLRHEGSPLSRVVSGLFSKRERDLAGDGVHAVYSALSGDSPRRAAWWESWKFDCRALRHRVAHTGALVSAVEAERGQSCRRLHRQYLTGDQ